MREQLVDSVNGMIRDSVKDVFQPAVWFDAVHFAGAE